MGRVAGGKIVTCLFFGGVSASLQATYKDEAYGSVKEL